MRKTLQLCYKSTSIENLHKAIEVVYLMSLSEDGDMHNNRRKAEKTEIGMEQDGSADDADDISDEDEMEMQAAGLYYDDELDDELDHDLDGEADD